MTEAAAKPPDLESLIRQWAYHHFGTLGLVVLALMGFVIYAYMNWDKVSTWPGIKPLLDLLKRKRIPKADPDRFSVVVARLEDDANDEHQRLIIEALTEFEGIQVLQLDRIVRLAGPNPEEAEKQALERTRSYLKKTGASVLIWGKILVRGGKNIPKLYWTASHGR